MNKPSINIQDGFLFQSLKDGRPMSIELVTGKHLKGKIRRFDRFAVVGDQAGLGPPRRGQRTSQPILQGRDALVLVGPG